MTVTIERTNGNNIINALKRLERVGSEESKTVTKLIEAAKELGDKICEIVADAGAVGVQLPRGYSVVLVDQKWCYGAKRWVGDYHLVKARRSVNSSGFDWVYTSPLLRDSNKSDLFGYAATTRATALAFASDLTDGLLDEIAAYIEERTTESQRAIEQIRAALESALAKLSAVK